MNAESLALIEYRVVDPDYDGKVFRSIWQDCRGNTANGGGGEVRSGREGLDLPQARPQFAFGDLEVVVGLPVQPHLRGLAEGATEAQRKLCRNRTFATDHMRDAHRRHANRARKGRLADAVIVQDLFEQFARMDGRQAVLRGGYGHAGNSSVVIDDFDIEGIATLETKAHPALAVDANAPLAGPIAFQSL
jgi:hypothetical protein